MDGKCTLLKDEEGNRICGIHRELLIESELTGDNPPGLGHIRTWVCPVTNEPFFEAQGM